MKKTSLIALLIIGNSVLGQTSSELFFDKANKIENLLRYKSKSPSQLRTLLNELKTYSAGNEKSYELIKNRVNNYLLPIEIKLSRSDIYNKRFSDAVLKTRQIKAGYPYNKSIEKLELYLDKKLYKYFKGDLMSDRSSWFTLEPSIAFYSQEVESKKFKDIVNVNPVYGLGFYYKFNKEEKRNANLKSIFTYNQIGIKIDYRDTNYRSFTNSAYTPRDPYFNTQLSFIYKRTLGLDFGFLGKSFGMNQKQYSITGSFYIPLGAASLGFNSRIITDFNSTIPLIQFGGTFKLNIGMYKSFTKRDVEEINVRVMKFKEE